jgi:hypothetical protein
MFTDIKIAVNFNFEIVGYIAMTSSPHTLVRAIGIPGVLLHIVDH